MGNSIDAWKEAQRQAGGPDALAQRLGIKRRTLFLWKSRGVPADRLADVSRITGISAAILRPDLARAFEAVS
jgi:DNA-binding transcriptional regulator YdaS (Cro superfamily)